ncbi:hypothetical protein RF11_14998 [Thelohanellus kitauei]|uniref:Uncharacterized protein n=1 Tax=Thelohanellus kitauei TaxID=669202 RepID=A0A0C2M9U1_THEKT|nr:hypothetical protein RF11_14998 [Thelohanellus kitauei]
MSCYKRCKECLMPSISLDLQHQDTDELPSNEVYDLHPDFDDQTGVMLLKLRDKIYKIFEVVDRAIKQATVIKLFVWFDLVSKNDVIKMEALWKSVNLFRIEIRFKISQISFMILHIRTGSYFRNGTLGNSKRDEKTFKMEHLVSV